MKMLEITAKLVLTHSHIMNKFMIRMGALREPTGKCDKASYVITCFIRNFIGKILFFQS
jgi:hypothetical protein